MSEALVIGYGNTLRRDDGVGPKAAEALMGLWPPDLVHVEPCHQLFVEQAAALSETEHAVFIDAREAPDPGTIEVRELAPAPAEQAKLSHFLNPETLLAASKHFYGVCPRAHLVSVAGLDFGHGEGLSAAVEAALPGVIDRVQALVEEGLKEKPHA